MQPLTRGSVEVSFRHRASSSLAALLVVASCSGDSAGDPNEPTGDCQDTFDFTETGTAGLPTSPAPGVMTVPGHFVTTETVLISWVDGNGKTQTLSDTPTTDRTKVSFVGLPSG